MRIKDDFDAYGRRCKSRFSKALYALTALGFYVVLLHRISAALFALGKVGQGLSRVVDLFCNLLSGCYISPKARISGGLLLPHATGVVIGEGVVIGKNVTIYQNVTLGSISVAADAYPIVNDSATLFTGAVVLGRVNIGRNATIGAMSVVLADVPEDGRAVGNPARLLC